MKKHVFKGAAAIGILALLVLNVSVVRNGKRTTHLKLNSGETVFADESNDSGSGGGEALFGEETHYYGTDAQGTRTSVVAWFNSVTQGMNVLNSSDIAAEIKASNPNISGTELQAQVNARMSSIMQNNATSSGGIAPTKIEIQGTSCPGWGGICFEESVMDAHLRVIRELRTGSGR